MPVYVIENLESGLMKIGHSAEPARRLNGLQTATPDDLCIVFLFDGGEKEEKMLHKAFAQYRHRGEWFKMSMDQIRAHGLDLTELPVPESRFKRLEKRRRKDLAQLDALAANDGPLTNTERQRRYLARHRIMKDALTEVVKNASSIEHAHYIARVAFDKMGINKKEKLCSEP